jgi:hypothetical protein
MNESRFVGHEPCPKCGSRDNLGVWDDGHKFCFGGCGYRVPPTTTMAAFDKPAVVSKDNSLPEDASYYIPPEPLKWLRQYITDKEIEGNQLMFSRRKEMLIYPYFDNNHELLLWQGRFFPARKPKTITYGYPDRHLILLGDASSEWVVAVEDAVSAIKVSRWATAMPLFGSHISARQAGRLAKRGHKLTIWLDFDKTKEGMKLRDKYAPMFSEIKVISTELDPKLCSDEVIKEKLND